MWEFPQITSLYVLFTVSSHFFPENLHRSSHIIGFKTGSDMNAEKRIIALLIFCLFPFIANREAVLQSPKKIPECLAQVTFYFQGLKNWYDDHYPDAFAAFRSDLRNYLAKSDEADLKRCIRRSIGKFPRRDYFITSYMLMDRELEEIKQDPRFAVETGKMLIPICDARPEVCKYFFHDILAGLAVNSARIGKLSEAKKYKTRAIEVSRQVDQDLGARSEEEWNLYDGI